MRTTVAIVEDNAGICHELEHVISRAADLKLIAICRNAPMALQTLPACVPDVILMDIHLPGQSGIECTARLKLVLPQTQILMFTIHDESELILQALRAGAIGYIFKNTTPEEILQAIREAKRGGSPMSGDAARKVIETFHREPTSALGLAQLTAREREVLQLLAQGLADKQIADRLSISLLTVNSHLKNIYTKLGVRSRTEAAAQYLNQA